jgi:hypothetical protein
MWFTPHAIVRGSSSGLRRGADEARWRCRYVARARLPRLWRAPFGNIGKVGRREQAAIFASGGPSQLGSGAGAEISPLPRGRVGAVSGATWSCMM